MKPEIVKIAERVARGCFLGIAIPHQPKLSKDTYGPIRSEKVLKFNRKALRRSGSVKVEKVDPRNNGGEDTMIIRVGKPGSLDRKAALAEQYAAILASGEEVSPFDWEG